MAVPRLWGLGSTLRVNPKTWTLAPLGLPTCQLCACMQPWLSLWLQTHCMLRSSACTRVSMLPLYVAARGSAIQGRHHQPRVCPLNTACDTLQLTASASGYELALAGLHCRDLAPTDEPTDKPQIAAQHTASCSNESAASCPLLATLLESDRALQTCGKYSRSSRQIAVAPGKPHAKLSMQAEQLAEDELRSAETTFVNDLTSFGKGFTVVEKVCAGVSCPA